MFQRLTSLFFSDSNTPEGLEEPKPFVEEEEEEDGWLIIDLAGEESNRTGFPQLLLCLVSPERGKPLRCQQGSLHHMGAALPFIFPSLVLMLCPWCPTLWSLQQPLTCSSFFPFLSQ